ncbi:MAG: hypothetical protein IJO94_08630, partial [Firmicutes bacterium]|nr:hypothetical protein [Bacillota bacterium]
MRLFLFALFHGKIHAAALPVGTFVGDEDSARVMVSGILQSSFDIDFTQGEIKGVCRVIDQHTDLVERIAALPGKQADL